MRVLHLLSSAGYYGAESVAAELARQLCVLGATVDVGVFDNGGRGNRRILDVAAPYIREKTVVPCRGQLDPRAVTFLREAVLRHRPDIVHSHSYKATFYALLATRNTSARLVVTYHNWLTDTWALRLYMALDKNLARFCDAAVAVSRPVARALAPYVREDRLRIIGNGIDTAAYTPADSTAAGKRRLGLEGKTLLGFVGRLTRSKGLSYLLRALAPLPSTVHAVLVGDGEHRDSILREAQALGIESRVHLLGSRSDLSSIYPAFDIFVLPSDVEAFPMVLLEAMACGLPIVATDVGDSAQIIEDRVSGRIVEPGNPDLLNRILNELLEDQATAQRLARAARERVAARFSSERMARSYLACYEHLLAPNTT